MMNIPNILTVFRIVLAGVFIYLLLSAGVIFKYIALACFLAASVTDFFDGYLARKWDMISTFGIILDPIADKVLVLSAFWIFKLLGLIPSWMAWVIIDREVLVTGLRFFALSKGIPIAAVVSGKYKTVAQMTTAILILIFICIKHTYLDRTGIFPQYAEQFSGFIISVLMWITVMLTAYSGIIFLVNNKRIFLNEQTD